MSALSNEGDAKTDVANSLITKLDQIEATLGRDSLSDQAYQDLRSELGTLRDEATEKRSALQPSLEEAQARLNALQPTETKEGEEASEEAAALIKQRKNLETQIAELDGQVKLIAASLLRVEQLNHKITLARQERFTKQLFEQNGSLLLPTLWTKGLQGFSTTTKVVSVLITDWFSFLGNQATEKLIAVAVVILIAWGLILGPLRWLVFKGLKNLSALEAPTALQRSLYAIWAILFYALLPVSLLTSAAFILKSANLLPPRVEQLVSHLEFVIFSLSLSYGLIRVLFAPRKPDYRLLNMETSGATRLYGMGIILLTIFGLETLFDETDELLFAPLETTILVSGVSAATIAVLIWMSLRTAMSVQPLHSAVATGEEVEKRPCFTLPGFVRLMQPLLWIASLIIAIAPFLGYIALATFLAEQIGRTFIVLALLGIVTAFMDNLLFEGINSRSNRFSQASQALGVGTKTVKQFGVLFGGILHILFYLAAALLIFAPWGVESSDFLTSMKNAVFNLQIGDLNISLINILGAIAVFVVTLVLVKSIQRWMENSLMPATGLDAGLKNSILTSVGYVGFVLAIMLGFSYMGLDLSNIAIVAGALSVGIGFGLQSIVNNFVSGLILLAERPIKTGDWVVVGSDQGYVKKISVRATKIETFDRATVIVPNSDLIANRVMNWMHNGSMGRIIIPVGVSYDADPEQVKEILLKIAQDSEYVTSYPGPSVYFMDFGASSLDFELRCYIQDINSSLSAKSDLRFAIFKAMKEANIEIPFPQRDIHVRSVSVAAETETILPQPSKPVQSKKQSPTRLQKDEIDLDDLADIDGPAGQGDHGEN